MFRVGGGRQAAGAAAAAQRGGGAASAAGSSSSVRGRVAGMVALLMVVSGAWLVVMFRVGADVGSAVRPAASRIRAELARRTVSEEVRWGARVAGVRLSTSMSTSTVTSDGDASRPRPLNDAPVAVANSIPMPGTDIPTSRVTPPQTTKMTEPPPTEPAPPQQEIDQPPPPLPPANSYNLATSIDLVSFRTFDARAPTCQLSPARQKAAEYQARQFFQTGDASFTCEFRRQGGTGFYCYGRRVIAHPELVEVARGGEDVESVLGRGEEAENANVLHGAFRFGTTGTCEKALLPNEHAAALLGVYEGLRSATWGPALISSLCGGPKYAASSGVQSVEELSRMVHEPPEVGELGTCVGKWDDTPTMFVHRYEYVNLFHTVTELVSAYQSLRAARKAGIVKPNEPVRLVFLDGHAQGNLDELWEAVFPGYAPLRIGQLPRNVPLCLLRVVFAQVGYASDINIHPGDVDEFNRKFVPVKSFGAEDRWCVDEDTRNVGKAVVAWAGASSIVPKANKVVVVMRDVGRRPAHPRAGRGEGERRTKLERAMVAGDAILPPHVQLMRGKGYDVSLAYLSDMPIQEQIKLLRSAGVVIGLHGAALMHMVFTDPARTLFVELSPQDVFMRMHFVKVAARMGQRFARLSPKGATEFLQNRGNSYVFSEEMMEAVVRWSILPTDQEKVRAMGAEPYLS